MGLSDTLSVRLSQQSVYTSVLRVCTAKQTWGGWSSNHTEAHKDLCTYGCMFYLLTQGNCQLIHVLILCWNIIIFLYYFPKCKDISNVSSHSHYHNYRFVNIYYFYNKNYTCIYKYIHLFLLQCTV